MSALTFATAQLMRVLPRRSVSRVMGRLADHAWHPWVGTAVVQLYARFYDVRFEECVASSGWESFDAFFTRELRDGARPIDPDPLSIVSPADGRIDSMGKIDEGRTFQIKGRPYRVEELVGDDAAAQRYVGGGACVVYLSPRDYHRVHAPVDGVIRRVRSMPGDYFPVNGVGVQHVPKLFAVNRRVAIEIESETHGVVTVVMVAAIVVGRITVSCILERDVGFGDHAVDFPVRRGDEIGMFHLGSTAVVFVEKRGIDRWIATDGTVRYGERIARAAEHARPNGEAPHRRAGGAR
jgi:phosphatidylserine decarboxylase